MTTTIVQVAQPAAMQQHLEIKPSITVSVTETAAVPAPTFRHRALIVNSDLKYELHESFEVPAELAPHEVKIRTCAVGLNQIDYKSVDYNFCLPQLPWVTGRELAGVVVQVGSTVQNLTVGQTVWSSTYYRDRRAGCFQDYIIVPQHTVSPMPSGMTFTSAACLGVCGLTAGMTLWRWFGLPMPFHMLPTPPASPPSEAFDTPVMLIWGGSSVTGQFLIQLAKRSGLFVITVSSSKTAKMLSELGADQVVIRDGKSNEEIIEEVKRIAGDDVTMGIDLVGAKTAVATLKCLSSTRPSRFAPLAWAPKVDVSENIQILNVEMKQFVLNPESGIYAEQLTKLIDAGGIKLPEIEILKGGLHAVEEGLERLKRGDMAGKKLVVDMLS